MMAYINPKVYKEHVHAEIKKEHIHVYNNYKSYMTWDHNANHINCIMCGK